MTPVGRCITFLVCTLPVHAVFAGSVSVSLAESRGACRVINLPRWTAPPVPVDSYPSEWPDLVRDMESELTFRTFDGGVLVGLSCKLHPTKGLRVLSPDKYAINLATGKVRIGTEVEWDNADAYVGYRDSTMRAGHVMEPGDRLVYRGREFRRAGPKWPTFSQDSARLSQDGSYLAVSSWDGESLGGGDMVSSHPLDDGNYYVTVYDTNSGVQIFALKGHFHDVTPEEIFQPTVWISKRCYVLILDKARMRRFVFCDVDKTTQRRRRVISAR
jgi:hypothetical protein